MTFQYLTVSCIPVIGYDLTFIDVSQHFVAGNTCLDILQHAPIRCLTLIVAGTCWYWNYAIKMSIVSMLLFFLAEISIERSCLWLDHPDSKAFISNFGDAITSESSCD